MRLEHAQGAFDILLVRIVYVIGFLGKKLGNPFFLGNLNGADTQGSQKTMPGLVIERFVMQIIRIQKLLQPVELISEGHGTPHH